MNQDQVKQKLLELDGSVKDFTVIFSGKKSGKVNGLYHPETREILIHNHNFTDDNALMYTAIHEFAHHIQFSRTNAPVSTRAHTNQFYDILHRLLFDAETKGIYANIFKTDGRFVELTAMIREKFLAANGQLMKEFGKLLLDANDLCVETGASFEDYLNRELGMARTSAKTMMKIHAMDINPEIGYDNMKTVAAMKDPDRVRMAEEAFLEGKSPEMVKVEFSEKKRPDSNMEFLLTEKEKLERTLDRLTARLAEIERKIQDLRFEN